MICNSRVNQKYLTHIQENPPASSEKGTKAPRQTQSCHKEVGQELDR